ncbi:MAG: hypothetical protein IPJ25_14935 [Rhodocyclaceae bacterium]|nr:hypothetical protein [Rhodocyclaceae bacterium]
MPFVPLSTGSTPRTGFIPLAGIEDEEPVARHGFTPLDQNDNAPERPSLLKTVALNNPLTAAGETAANLGSQLISIPAAGLAGLSTIAGNALGLTDAEPADVVHAVGGALTYQPRGELGKAATSLVQYPFEKLAEGGQMAGDATLGATGSPVAATAVDTTVNALPMALGIRGRAKPLPETGRGFVPYEEAQPNVAGATERAPSEPMPMPDSTAEILNAGSVDEAIAQAQGSLNKPITSDKPPPFSARGYTPALLERLARTAKPETRALMEAEIARRQQVMAVPDEPVSTVSADTLPDTLPEKISENINAESPSQWSVQRSPTGNMIISGNDVRALIPELRKEIPGLSMIPARASDGTLA